MLPGKTYTPDAVLEAVWRHKWLIILPFVVITTGAVIYSRLLPDLYRSETLILVVPQRIPDSYVRSTVTSRIEDRLQSISDQIRSRTRLEQLIYEFNLYPQQRATKSMEEVVELMDRQIKVDTVRGDSFRIAFEAEDVMVPVKVTTRLAEMFITENQRDRTTTAEDTSRFLESQLADAKERLLDHERKLEAFRLRNAGELPSQMQSNLQVIQATRDEIQSLAESINRDRDRRLLLEKSLADSEAMESVAVESALAAREPAVKAPDPLDIARGELQALEARLTANHPDVIAKRRAVEKLENSRPAEIDAPVAATPAAAAVTPQRRRARQIQDEIDRIDAQLRSREIETARLQAVAAEYQRRVEAIPSRETEMTELMRDYQTLQQIYTSLLSKKEDSNIAANLERRQIGEQFKVLDPARPAERPFAPDRPRIILMGALAGLVIGLGFVGLREYRDTSLRFEEDIVSILSLPVLAVVPFMESPRERRQRQRRVVFVGAVGVLGLVIAVGAVAAELGWLS